jgi:hypothetical protein
MDQQEAKPIEGLTEGRMVHFVMPNGKHRPAVIVQVWDRWQGTSNLQVFTDGNNDGGWGGGGLYWATSIMYSEDAKPSTWHWIERE